VRGPHPRLRRDEHGIAAVELALLSPILVVLLIGLVDVGRVMQRYTTLQHAVRAGADFAVAIGVMPGTVAQVRDAVLRVAPADPSGTRTVEASMRCECAGAAAGCGALCEDGRAPWAYVTVALSETLQPIVPYPYFGDALPVSSAVTVRVN
jgi:Flp pilus assembly pilin Flp